MTPPPTPRRRSTPWLWAVCGLWGIASAWLLGAHRLPFIDLPQHAATLAMLRNPGVYAADFRVQLVPWATNSLWFTLDPLLAPLLTVEQSLRLNAALAVLAVPLALAAYTRVLGGRAATGALLGAAVAFSRPLLWGFLHYSLSLPLGVALLALDLDRARRPGGRAGLRSLALAAGLLLLFVVHAQTLAFVFGALGLQRLAVAAWGADPRHADRPLGARLARGLLALAAPAAPAVAVFGAWVAENLVAPADAEAPLGTLTAGLGARHVPIMDALGAFPLHLQAYLKDSPLDDVLTGALLLLALAGWAGGAWAAARRGDRSSTAAAVTALGVAVAAFALYLLLPLHIRGQYYLSTRMAPWVLLALLPFAGAAVLPPRLDRARRGLALLLAGGGLAVAAHAVIDFDAESQPLDRVLASVEPGSKLMLWAQNRSTRAVPSNPYTHYLSWTAAETLGTTHFSFAEFRPNPVVYRDRDAMQRSIPGEEFKAWCTAFAGYASDIDYVVTRDSSRKRPMCGALEVYADHLALVGHDADWSVYRVTTPLPAADVRCSCPKRR